MASSSPLVPRATVWFYACERPYVDLCIKGVQFFVEFDRILSYSRPAPGASIAIYDDEDDGDLPLRVPPWSWWLQFDVDATADGRCTSELSCTNHGILGHFVQYRNSETGANVSLSVTESEGAEIAEAVEHMMQQARADADGNMVDDGRYILRSIGLVPRFRVQTQRYDHSLWTGYEPPRQQQRRHGRLERSRQLGHPV